MEQIQSNKANPLKTKLQFELQSSLPSGEYVDQIQSSTERALKTELILEPLPTESEKEPVV